MGHDGIYNSVPKQPELVEPIKAQNVVFSEAEPISLSEVDIAWGEVGLAASAVLRARRERNHKQLTDAFVRLKRAYGELFYWTASVGVW